MRLFLSVIVAISLMAASWQPVLADTGRDVLDESGNVLIRNVTKEDIPRLIDYYCNGGYVGNQAGSYLSEFGRDAVSALLEAMGRHTAPSKIIPMLTQTKDPSVIPPISKLLIGNQEEKSYAQAALVNFGDAAAPYLLQMVKDNAYFKAATDTLKSTEPTAVTRAALRGMLDSKDQNERAGAYDVLGFWRDDYIAAPFAKTVVSDTDFVREAAFTGYIACFVQTPEKFDTVLMVGLLKDPDPAIRADAALVLMNRPYPPAYVTLVSMLKTEKDARVREFVVSALAELKDDRAVLPFIEIVRDGGEKYGAKANAVYGLRLLKAKEAIPYITALVDKGQADEKILKDVCECLKEIGEPVDLGPFLKYLNNTYSCDTMVELMALIDTNAKAGDKRLVDALVDYRDHAKGCSMPEQANGILARIK